MRPLSFRRFLAPLLLAACFALSWRPLNADDDFWAHAAVGRWMWEHRAWPSESLFLWSSEPTLWIAHSWGAQSVFYALMQAGGGWNAGVNVSGAASSGFGPLVAVAFTCGVITLCYALLWHWWNRHARAGTVAVLLFSVAFFVGGLRFHPRPELFTALLWTMLLIFLSEQRNDLSHDLRHGERATSSTRSRGKTWWRESGIVVMFVFWTNLHGAVALGIGVLLLTALCDLVQFRADEKSRRLLALAATCVAATAFNPYGFVAYWKAVLLSSQSATFSRINEWLPALTIREIGALATDGAMPALLLHAILVLFLASAALLFWNQNGRRHWVQALWVVVVTALFFEQRRHMWLAALTCLTVLAANADALGKMRALQRWNTRMRRDENMPLPPLFRATFVGAAWLIAIVLSTRLAPLGTWHIVSPQLPDGACSALEKYFAGSKKAKPIQVFNEYETSSYLQWRLNRPQSQVADRVHADRVLDAAPPPRFALFIDLLNAYPDAVTTEYIALLKSDGATLYGRGAQAIVFSAAQRQSALVKKLKADNRWRQIYSGADGDVWVAN